MYEHVPFTGVPVAADVESSPHLVVVLTVYCFHLLFYVMTIYRLHLWFHVLWVAGASPQLSRRHGAHMQFDHTSSMFPLVLRMRVDNLHTAAV